MSFEKDFPGLSDWRKKFDDNGKTKESIGHYFYETEIDDFCLDKQRVREAIIRIQDDLSYAGCILAFDKLKKELGLDKE